MWRCCRAVDSWSEVQMANGRCPINVQCRAVCLLWTYSAPSSTRFSQLRHPRPAVNRRQWFLPFHENDNIYSPLTFPPPHAMRPSFRSLASATAGPKSGSLRPAPMALLPPIPLYRRLLRAHRKFLPHQMRTLGDEYIKAEFRAHRQVDNPQHLVGPLDRQRNVHG